MFFGKDVGFKKHNSKNYSNLKQRDMNAREGELVGEEPEYIG